MAIATSTMTRAWLGAGVAAVGLLAMRHETSVRDRAAHVSEQRAAAQPSPDVWASGYDQQIWRLCARDPDAAACSSDMARAVLEPPALDLRPGPMTLDDGGLRAADRYRDVGMPRGRVLLGDRAAEEAFRLSDGAERQLRRWLLRP